MPLTRAKKTEKVTALASELEHSTSAIIGTFTALTASKDMDLRKTVREAGGSYHVVKNKLAARAAKGTKIEAALQGLKGVSSVAYTSGDPVALAKALSTWVKDNAEFTFKLGIVDGKVITVEEIAALATLPGKEELFSKLLFLIQSPAQRLVTVINATGRDLAVVINQACEKGKFAALRRQPRRLRQLRWRKRQRLLRRRMWRAGRRRAAFGRGAAGEPTASQAAKPPPPSRQRAHRVSLQPFGCAWRSPVWAVAGATETRRSEAAEAVSKLRRHIGTRQHKV